jgi:diadenosine tetraphosphate (Ap4A) HIT family hydrolase
MARERTLFDEIIEQNIPAWVVWEDDSYLAFLTPFPNTPGLTVVIPKENPGDYIFDVDDDATQGLMMAAKKVAKLLEKALGVTRVAMVFEGTGVAHVHAKLYPLHGKLGTETNVWSKHQEFFPEYIGYLSTVEGPRMSDEELDGLCAKILEASR